MANPNGRPPAITAEKVDKILQAVRIGVSLEAAAGNAGVPKRTFFDWLARGREPNAKKIYRDLADQIEEALASFETTALARITKAGEEHWQADAWRLERKFPDRYARRTKVESNVTVSAVPFIDMSRLTVEQAETLLELLRLASPAQDQLPAEGRPVLELVAGTLEDTA
jgi:transposase